MTEIWSGVIDAFLDASVAVGQLYASYVFSGVGKAEERDELAIDDAETSFKDRVVIRDRDCIPLPHIGMWLQLVLRKDAKTRSGVKTYVVCRLITARPAQGLVRSVFSRALCNGIAQCKARAERIRAKAANRSTTLLKDVPISQDVVKYVSGLCARPYNEVAVLLFEKHRLDMGVYIAVRNFYVHRNIFVDPLLRRLFTALKDRPLCIRGSDLSACSVGQLLALVQHIETADAFSMLFGASCKAVDESYRPSELHNAMLLQTGVVGVVQALDPLETMSSSRLEEFKRSCTGVQHLRNLLQTAKSLLPSATEAHLEKACTMHQSAMRKVQYGSTVFSHADGSAMEALNLWIRVPTSHYSQRLGLNDYTTVQLHNRAEQLTTLLKSFEVVLATIDGGCRLMDRRDIDSVLGDRNTTLGIAPRDCDVYQNNLDRCSRWVNCCLVTTGPSDRLHLWQKRW